MRTRGEARSPAKPLGHSRAGRPLHQRGPQGPPGSRGDSARTLLGDNIIDYWFPSSFSFFAVHDFSKSRIVSGRRRRGEKKRERNNEKVKGCQQRDRTKSPVSISAITYKKTRVACPAGDCKDSKAARRDLNAGHDRAVRGPPRGSAVQWGFVGPPQPPLQDPRGARGTRARPAPRARLRRRGQVVRFPRKRASRRPTWPTSPIRTPGRTDRQTVRQTVRCFDELRVIRSSQRVARTGPRRCVGERRRARPRLCMCACMCARVCTCLCVLPAQTGFRIQLLQRHRPAGQPSPT